MKIQITWLLLLLGTVVFVTTEARRVRVRPLQQEDEDEEEQVQYYSSEPVGQQQQRVVLVSSADQYNGLYGQPTASSRNAQDNYIPSSRAALAAAKASGVHARTKEPSKTPPAQTIRNYNKVNDDGSFTFGYEADDGSFKEETRGTDCVVRGKYGYVDPDGNKREFTYVSGNPCDPNAPKEEEQEESQENESAEDGRTPNYPTQQNYPSRPIRPLRPVTVTVSPKPAVTLFQTSYEEERSEEEQPEPEQVLRQQPIRRPTYISRPQYLQQPAVESQIYQQRPQYVPSTTPASLIYKQNYSPISITPRPVSPSPTPTPKAELPATTYRPQLLQLSVTPRPSYLYTKQIPTTTTTPTAISPSLSFETEIQKFQHDNTISPTPSSLLRTTPKIPKASTSTTAPVYSSAIVFDPSTGQYKTQLYQSLPQTEGDFTLNQRLQPYVHQPSRQPVINIQQLQQRSPIFPPFRGSPSVQSLSRVPSVPQAAYQQQQAEIQFQNSAQLYAEQQKARAAQQQQQQQHHQQQRHQPQQQQRQKQPSQFQTQPQALYYIQPSVDQSQAIAAGQIDAFLRGHNIQF